MSTPRLTEFKQWWAQRIVASVVKLQGGDTRQLYLVWKAKVKRILQNAGLWELVDPDQNVDSVGVSAAGASNRNIPLWKRDSRDVIQSALAFQLQGSSDPRECWIYLQNKFAPNNAVQRYWFLRQLWNLRMQEEETAKDFFDRVRLLLDILGDMGVFGDEKVLVLLIINALPRNWRKAAIVYWREALSGRTIQTTEDLFQAMTRTETSSVQIISEGSSRVLREVPRQQV